MQILTTRLQRLPIRLRLTVWHGVLLAAVMVLFGAALWIGLRIRLDGAFDDQLRNQAALTLAAVETRDGTIGINAGDPIAARQIGSFVRLIAHDGRVIADTSPPLSAVPLDQGDIEAALAGETQFSSVRVAGRPVRIVTIPVDSSGVIAGALQVGVSRSEIDEVMHELLVAILIAAPAAVLAALAGGYLLARRALAPVAAITRLAAGISGGNDLNARLGLTLPDDELGDLAATFDGMLDRVERSFERQRRFAGDAAHELRTPLALMRGRIDLARERPRSSEEYRTALDGLDGDLVRLTDVVGALLVLARSDVGQLTIERDSFDLAETIGWIVDQYAQSAATAGVGLRGEVIPAPIDGDEDLLVQLLVNLVDNALAYTSPGDDVVLGCQAVHDEVLLWVADTGVGIAPKDHERVFDRFYRADPGRARHAGGIGLGLSLCRAIAEAHGGKIALTSELGQGTRVDVRLPKTPRTGG